MIPFDANIHLPCREGEAAERIMDESSMDVGDLLTCLTFHRPHLHNHLESANFMVFTDRLSPDDMGRFCAATEAVFPGSVVTWLADFRAPDIDGRLAANREAGVAAVKFHSYVQTIGDADFPDVVAVAESAQNLAMPVLIDTSYGTTAMYRYDNLKLAAAVAETVTEVPVVLLHSGGTRVLEAMLLADACPNVFLETSFTLPYLRDSSVERDLAFAYKKVAGKVLYGSDFPYVNLDHSIEVFQLFLERWNFTEIQVRGFLGNNAKKVFSS